MKEYNIIVKTDEYKETDKELFFGDEEVIFVPETTTMWDVLVECGVFKSKSEARKNFTRTGKDIPDGFTDLEGLGKLKTRITILKMRY